jgi:hypothetical protein
MLRGSLRRWLLLGIALMLLWMPAHAHMAKDINDDPGDEASSAAENANDLLQALAESASQRANEQTDKFDTMRASRDERNNERFAQRLNEAMIEVSERETHATEAISEQSNRGAEAAVDSGATKAAMVMAEGDEALHSLADGERLQEANIRREEETSQMRLKRTIEKTVELGRDAEERLRFRGADAEQRLTKQQDDTEAMFADHNDETSTRLDARLALAEKRLSAKLEAATRRLQAQDAEDERQALLAERRLSALADEAERRIAMNADHGVLGRTITEQGAYAQMTARAADAQVAMARIHGQARNAVARIGARRFV